VGDSRRYHEFAKFIAKNFSDRSLRIADVAGGKGYLQLSLRELGYQNVKTFDKRYKRLHKINYQYGWFSYDTNEHFDLVVGMHPDEGTDHIIEYAKKNQSNFVVCPCCVKPSARPFTSPKSDFANWLNHLKRLANGFRLGETQLRISGKNTILWGVPR